MATLTAEEDTMPNYVAFSDGLKTGNPVTDEFVGVVPRAPGRTGAGVGAGRDGGADYPCCGARLRRPSQRPLLRRCSRGRPAHARGAVSEKPPPRADGDRGGGSRTEAVPGSGGPYRRLGLLGGSPGGLHRRRSGDTAGGRCAGSCRAPPGWRAPASADPDLRAAQSGTQMGPATRHGCG